MKNLCYFIVIFCLGIEAKGQIINFPDANFKNMLLTANTNNLIAANTSGTFIKIDANNNGEIEIEEALLVKKLQFNGYHFPDQPNIPLSVIGLEYFDNVEYLDFDDKYIPSLDVRTMDNLKYIHTSPYSKISSLNASGSTSILEIDCSGARVLSIDVSNASNLQSLLCYNCGMTSLNASGATSLQTLNCSNNSYSQTLNVDGLINLESLDCSHIYSLPTIDVSSLVNLRTLNCYKSNFTSLDVSGLTNLETLTFDGGSYHDSAEGNLASLILTGAVNLKYLDCRNNRLNTLDVSGLPNLEHLNCRNNELVSLNLDGLTQLKFLGCGSNNLTSLDLTDLVSLTDLSCNENQLTTLDLSQATLFKNLGCTDNYLESLFLKNGSVEDLLVIGNFQTLTYICGDDSQMTQLQDLVALYPTWNCEVNSYCSFSPGGTSYAIAGSNTYDFDENGCTENDLIFPYLKFNITNGTASGTLISNDSGNYSIFVNAGTHTITPLFENPDYFLVSPASTTVTFPAENSPFAQNFCITPNGIHSDLEVNIIPLSQARPGFDAIYKIVYKNKGNQTQSGTVSFAFNDSALDFITSSVAPSSQPMNYLNWDFIGLKPFETRTIFTTFNVNSPLETPPVNGGFVLDYTLSVYSSNAEETPADNIFVLHQTVVNSFDPNNKICLEGSTISPELVGKFVHYVINFENTGSANAENIVVTDEIDTTKFDISTLVPITGSHPFITKRSENNKVEFIFENINLPFDDANNDGYLAFKIKTISTLNIDDSFSNYASIYFDYNAPVVTEPAVTTIRTLADSNFQFDTPFSVLPNPSNYFIQVSNLSNEEFEIQITSMLGKILIKERHSDAIDVSNLAQGMYLVTIHQGERTSTQKIIKN